MKNGAAPRAAKCARETRTEEKNRIIAPNRKRPYVFMEAQYGTGDHQVMMLSALVTAAAQINNPFDISIFAASGGVTDGRYTNSFFRLTVDVQDASLQLDPLVNTR